MQTFNIDSKEDVKELFSALAYGSYAANRGYGMTHEQLISIGIGNEAMKEKYEKEIARITKVT